MNPQEINLTYIVKKACFESVSRELVQGEVWHSVYMKSFLKKIQPKYVYAFALIALLIFTRFVHLDWGMPFPFHPDERNMAAAIQQLQCTGFNTDCLHPHFFAYGQFPLYLGWFLIKLYQLLTGGLREVTFVQATMSLRIISAVSSVLSVWIGLKTVGLFLNNKSNQAPIFLGALFLIFSPGLIQMSHFGTTESLLAFFYILLIYLCLKFYDKRMSLQNFILSSGIILGLALSTKISAAVFYGVVVLTLMYILIKKEKKLKVGIFSNIVVVVTSFLTFVLTSPHSIIHFSEFLSSILYESAVATGDIQVFYTQQFQNTIPILFQLTQIFPYAIGFAGTALFLVSFLFLRFNVKVNLLRIAFLLYFIPQAILYTKWTRFVAPVFPIVLLFIALFAIKVYKKYTAPFALSVLSALVIFQLIQGAAYISIYLKPDTRFVASNWMAENFQNGEVFVQESGNVINLPLLPADTPFLAETTVVDLYSFEENYTLKTAHQVFADAEYVIIPSRRVLFNYTCFHRPETDSSLEAIWRGRLSSHCEKLRRTYPAVHAYYEYINTHYQLVQEFTSYPQFLFFSFPDEYAEESFSVFDHPAVRIYRKS